VEEMGCSQANVSRHLSLLYQEGLLARRKEGTTVYYSIGDASVEDLCKIVCARIG
jgi:DNA-binding transcriptional ArsR family regulator